VQFISGQENNIKAVFTFASSTPCSVNKAVNFSNIELENTVDVFDIQTTGSNVRSYQNSVTLWVPELIQNSVSRALIQITMDRYKTTII
jgi:hypothetical protein